MAQAYKPPKKNGSIYKVGKLSKGARFSSRKSDKRLIIVLTCVVLSFLFAIILGNILGDRAETSLGSAPSVGGQESTTLPNVNKVPPNISLNAYFVDISNVSPDTSISLSVHTEVPRKSGNALYFELQGSSGKLLYTSELAKELGFNCSDNLKLSRLNNHFQYYADHTVGLFKSDFSATDSASKRVKTQNNEILLLSEWADGAFEQIVVEFDDTIDRNNVVYYQTYLINLKLACEGVSIGIKIPISLLSSADNAGVVASLMSAADFYLTELGNADTNAILSLLDPLTYYTERYNGTYLISKGDTSTLAERISALESKGVKHYVVK